jgi:hypothetical protein
MSTGKCAEKGGFENSLVKVGLKHQGEVHGATSYSAEWHDNGGVSSRRIVEKISIVVS